MSKNNGLICYYCGKEYDTEKEARDCENNHDVIFLPLLKEDLNRLLNFIATGERKLLTDRLMKTLFQYMRGNTRE